MWHLSITYQNVISEIQVANNIVSFYTSDYVLHLLDKIDLEELCNFQFESDSNYKIFDEKLYFSNGKILCIVNIHTGKVIEKYDTGKDYITILTENLFVVSTYIKLEKQYENVIINYDKQPIFEIDKKFGVYDNDNSYILLYNNDQDKIAIASIIEKRILWTAILSDKLKGLSIIRDKFVIVPFPHSLMKIEIKTGKILWNTSIEFISHCSINESEKRLFSLDEHTFQIINVDTGEIELQKEIGLQVRGYNTYYAEGYLYFSGYKDDNTTKIFGAVDVNTGEVAFTQSIETPNGEVYSGSYDRPVVVGNRLYIRDQNRTLYIYERE